MGTDEHGSKIVRNYHQNSFKYDDIQDFVDHISSFYREEFNAINIDAENSVFIRTTDRLHQENCQKVWSKIESKLTKVTFLTLIRGFWKKIPIVGPSPSAISRKISMNISSEHL